MVADRWHNASGIDGYSREGRVAPQHSSRIPEIGEKIVAPAKSQSLAALIAYPLGPAELDARAALRFGSGDTGLDQIVGIGVDMEADFVLHRRLEALTPQAHIPS